MNPSAESWYWWYKGRLSAWQLAGLGIASGLLASASWHPYNATLLIFLAFVPLLLAGEAIAVQGGKRGNRFWRVSYLAMFVFNLITTWWVKNATVEGATAAIVLNAALMTIPLAIYYRARLRWGVVAGLCVWAPAWLLFEKLHLGWDLTWPWLTLGNTFAARATWVQWYSITGHLGGSAWVLWVNAILFLGFCHSQREHLVKAVCWATAAVLLMVTISLCMLPFAVDYRMSRTEVVVVQPNIDPYTQKFEGTPDFIPFSRQIERMERLSDSLITPRTRWVLWPETALDVNLNEADLETDGLIRAMQLWVDSRPGLNLIVGSTTYVIYPPDQAPAGARYSDRIGAYDIFNSALHIQAGGRKVEVYHKSKLVPGVEGMPYPAVVGPLTNLVIDLGGTAGGLGRQPERVVFATADGRQKLGPAICYESVFGDFMADFPRAGGQAIAIITNDAWWGRTPGHEQHLLMARLRAIEERRWLARSANTGISAFIDPAGTLGDTLSYGRMGALRSTIGLSDAKTGYLIWGDLGLIGFILVLCLWQGLSGYRRREGFYSRN